MHVETFSVFQAGPSIVTPLVDCFSGHVETSEKGDQKMEGGHAQEEVEEALFNKMGGLPSLLGARWQEAAVLLAGPSSHLMLRLVNSLALAGLPRSLVLVSQLLQE